MLSRPPPPLNYVRSFECSARHLSFTRAAEELGYTQAAISIHVRSLERYLGCELFHRHPRSLALTETGEAFLPTLRQALQLIDHATETVVVTNKRNTVTISCPMSLAENWLASQMAGFRAMHPAVEIFVYGTIWDATSVPASDLVISMHRDEDAPRGAIRILRERISLLAAPEWAEKVKDLKEVQTHPMIVVLGRQEYWTAFSEAIGGLDLDISGSIRTNATNIALEIAASGAGITASPRDLAQTYLDRGVLVELFDFTPESPWSYYLTESATPSRISLSLKDWIMGNAGRSTPCAPRILQG